MKTEKEMVRFLMGEGYTASEVAEAVDYLKENNYINDENYVRMYYMSCRENNWGEYKILYELENKGVPKSTAEMIIDDYKESEDYEGLKDDNAYALRVGMKMAKNQISEGKIMDQQFFGKVGRRLTNLGYRKNTVYYVISKLKPGSSGGGIGIEELPKDVSEMLAKIKLAQEQLENIKA